MTIAQYISACAPLDDLFVSKKAEMKDAFPHISATGPRSLSRVYYSRHTFYERVTMFFPKAVEGGLLAIERAGDWYYIWWMQMLQDIVSDFTVEVFEYLFSILSS